MELIKIELYKNFTDLTKFPGARMYGIHEFIMNDGVLEIKTTMQIEGVLSFIWRKLVAEKIADTEEEQTNKLIERVIDINNKK